MDDQLAFDSDTADSLTVMYRSEGMRRRRDIVFAEAALSPGDHVVDLGCGPGFYLAPMVEAVGPTGRVTAVDPSPDMLATAATRVGESGAMELKEGSASAIPLDDSSVDVVVSVQVFEYIGDVPRALAEISRVLRPGGRILIWDTDWSSVSCRTNDDSRHAAMMAAWDMHLADPVSPRTLGPAMRAAGFGDVKMAGHSFAMSDASPGTMADGLVNVIHGYLAGHPEVGLDKAAVWEADLRDLDSRGEFFLAYMQFLFSATI